MNDDRNILLARKQLPEGLTDEHMRLREPDFPWVPPLFLVSLPKSGAAIQPVNMP